MLSQAGTLFAQTNISFNMIFRFLEQYIAPLTLLGGAVV